MVSGRASATIGVRISRRDREILEKVCKARGEDISSFVRRVIRKELAQLNFYPEEVKKALGLPTEEKHT